MDIQIHTQIVLSAKEFELLEKAADLLHEIFIKVPGGVPEETLAVDAESAIDEFLKVCEPVEGTLTHPIPF